jgi:hypothetical protein
MIFMLIFPRSFVHCKVTQYADIEGSKAILPIGKPGYSQKIVFSGVGEAVDELESQGTRDGMEIPAYVDVRPLDQFQLWMIGGGHPHRLGIVPLFGTYSIIRVAGLGVQFLNDLGTAGDREFVGAQRCESILRIHIKAGDFIPNLHIDPLFKSLALGKNLMLPSISIVGFVRGAF